MTSVAANNVRDDVSNDAPYVSWFPVTPSRFITTKMTDSGNVLRGTYGSAWRTSPLRVSDASVSKISIYRLGIDISNRMVSAGRRRPQYRFLSIQGGP